MLDDRVRSVLARLEAEDDADREADLPLTERSLAVGPDAGRLLFALVAPNAGCEVLEIGGSRGYSTIWLAAAARILGGRVVSLEREPAKAEAWRRNIAEAGLGEWAELVEGDARESLVALEDGFDVVFLDAWKPDYKKFFDMVFPRLAPGGLFLAHNVLNKRSEMRPFLATIEGRPDLYTTILAPSGEGMSVSWKRR